MLLSSVCFGQNKLPRDYGIISGNYETGTNNAITDVSGVKVGHTTIIEGSDIRTGVTAVLPHDGNIFMDKVPAAMYIANGFGKLTGYSQVEELGEIETPIILTNTLSVPTAADALIDYVLYTGDNKKYVRSINPIVGETNDGSLNDIQGRHVTKDHVIEAITTAKQVLWQRALLVPEREPFVLDTKAELEQPRAFCQKKKAATPLAYWFKPILAVI